jgi:hypothetical protein
MTDHNIDSPLFYSIPPQEREGREDPKMRHLRTEAGVTAVVGAILVLLIYRVTLGSSRA